VVESHTDNKGQPDELQTLTQERAQAIADKLMSVGVDQNRIEVKGLGGSLPVSPNTTNVSRAKNRRVEVILVPNLN
jgi:outer membrane protein OmpA-like peptidoglycan-associated protein